MTLVQFLLNRFFVTYLPTFFATHAHAQGHPSSPPRPDLDTLDIRCYPAQTIHSATDSLGYIVIEKMPLFPGVDDTKASHEEKYQQSQQKLAQYVNSRTHYPALAREEGLEGDVVIQFVVEKTGNITGAKCLNDIGMGCCEEALRAVQSMNSIPKKWTPAERLGKPVSVQMEVVVRFRLS